MISYTEFGKLRLNNYLDNDEIERCEDFYFMEDTWAGLTAGFTEWLQLEDEPDVTRSVSLDLDELAADVQEKMLTKLELPVHKGMNRENILGIFGTPVSIDTNAGDRESFEYLAGATEKYYLSFTVHESDGLIYIVMMNTEAAINSLKDIN